MPKGKAGRKLTRATVSQDVAGDVVGEGQVEWLMSYGTDGTAHLVGLQQFEGTIDGREGSTVLETIGDFDGSEATWAAKVVPGSGRSSAWWPFTSPLRTIDRSGRRA
jgi:Protein of unknown function (DUF3224)